MICNDLGSDLMYLAIHLFICSASIQGSTVIIFSTLLGPGEGTGDKSMFFSL